MSSVEPSQNPYEVLEIAPGASPDEIKAAYHRLAKQWHPDRFSGAEKEAAEVRFRAFAEAFNALKDEGRREQFSEAAARGQAQAKEPSIPLQTAAAYQPKTFEDWIADAKEALTAREGDRAVGFAQMALRMDSERAEGHALLAKALELTNGDRRLMVKSLETAIRLDPKDADSTIQLAETYQALGMLARATRLWEVARNLAPNHRYFVQQQKAAEAQKRKGAEAQGLGEQFSALVERIKGLFNH